MTEKEKGELGLLYDANYDPEILENKTKSQDLCHEYNALMPSNQEKKREIIKKLLNRTGENFVIEQPFFCDYGYNLEIGENFYSNYHTTILDAAKVTFGDNVFIGPNCGFYAAGHPIEKEQRNIGLEYAKPITIGSDVWFGGNVVVLPGVTIGEDCVIGAGSVVNKDIPPHSIAVGNPCKVIKTIK